ncbi:AAA family ATPase [Leucobacter sp. NPDC015123]|uniref:AAA family ATPase n=1 Tax=Leucobacter sp. NPDC015123 TaxID=3364129 RepID=UPI0036F4821B
MSDILNNQAQENPVQTVKKAAKPGPPPALATRKPSGLPSWPVILLAGREKTGKSYHAALASSSALIGRTLWLGFGEKDPDEYGAIPGARFEIVEYDGTLSGLQAFARAAVAQPQEDGKPNLIIVDSGTVIWDTLRDKATWMARQRGSINKNTQEPIVGMDLWNHVTGEWNALLRTLRSHNGPVIITARMDTTTVMNDRGQPTPVKEDKVKGQRNLAYDVDAIIEMPSRGRATLTGARSVLHKLPERMDIEDFDTKGIDWLWRSLGLDKHATAQAVYTEAAPVDG